MEGVFEIEVVVTVRGNCMSLASGYADPPLPVQGEREEAGRHTGGKYFPRKGMTQRLTVVIASVYD